jgi:hypothetical protein
MVFRQIEPPHRTAIREDQTTTGICHPAQMCCGRLGKEAVKCISFVNDRLDLRNLKVTTPRVMWVMIVPLLVDVEPH